MGMANCFSHPHFLYPLPGFVWRIDNDYPRIERIYRNTDAVLSFFYIFAPEMMWKDLD